MPSYGDDEYKDKDKYCKTKTDKVSMYDPDRIQTAYRPEQKGEREWLLEIWE